MIKALGEPGLCGLHLVPGQRTLVWSHGKNGNVETRGQGYWCPRPRSRGWTPFRGPGAPGALGEVTVSAPAPCPAHRPPGHSVPGTHPTATPDKQVPRHMKAHTAHAELWV